MQQRVAMRRSDRHDPEKLRDLCKRYLFNIDGPPLRLTAVGFRLAVQVTGRPWLPVTLPDEKHVTCLLLSYCPHSDNTECLSVEFLTADFKPHFTGIGISIYASHKALTSTMQRRRMGHGDFQNGFGLRAEPVQVRSGNSVF